MVWQWDGGDRFLGYSLSLGGGSDTNCYIEYDEDITSYTIQAKYENDQWQVRVVENVDNHDYYWVSPQVTGGKKLAAFKLIASRNRNRDAEGKVGDGQISNRYYTFTIKDDDLKDYTSAERLFPQTHRCNGKSCVMTARCGTALQQRTMSEKTITAVTMMPTSAT